MIIHYEFGLLIAMAAFTYSYLLTRPNSLLNGWYNRLHLFFKTDERQQKGKPYHPLFMLLIHCEKCIAGQAALWIYLALNWQQFIYAPVFALLRLIFFITFSIFAAAFIHYAWRKFLE